MPFYRFPATAATSNALLPLPIHTETVCGRVPEMKSSSTTWPSFDSLEVALGAPATSRSENIGDSRIKTQFLPLLLLVSSRVLCSALTGCTHCTLIIIIIYIIFVVFVLSLSPLQIISALLYHQLLSTKLQHNIFLLPFFSSLWIETIQPPRYKSLTQWWQSVVGVNQDEKSWWIVAVITDFMWQTVYSHQPPATLFPSIVDVVPQCV